MNESFTLRALDERDRGWVASLLEEHWGGALIVTRGTVYQADRLPGFAAFQGEEPVGLATYRLDGDECELMSLDSLAEGIGVGSALIAAVKAIAVEAGCRRLWLITTNDNLHALRFYQRQGFTLAMLYPNALAESRKRKPSIPLIGLDGIPLRDEIELEMVLLHLDEPNR